MATGSDYDIIIVGAGMVGAAFACALGDGLLKVAVVERQRPVLAIKKEPELRVSAITRASENVFRNVGAWPGMVARRVSPIREMEVWDAGGGGAVHFDSADIGEPYLGHIIENSVVAAALIERLEDYANVDFIAPAHIDGLQTDPRGVEMVLDRNRRLRARLVVGADGARSRVRAHAGVPSRGWSYDQTAIVATVHTEQPHRETAWQRFTPDGPLAFLPLADGSCSIVWSSTTARAEPLLALDAAAFKRALGEAFEHRLGAVTRVSRRAGFPLRLAHAQTYLGTRLALVGDAAHTIHPLAGQGANLGIADAATLAQVLNEACARGEDIGSHRVLRRYERWRKGENLLMMGMMDAFKRAFGTAFTPVRTIRDVGMGLVDHAGPIKHLLMRRAMGLAGDLPQLALQSPYPVEPGTR